MLLEKQWYLLTSLDVCSDFSASPIVCQLVWGAESLQGRLSINPRRPLWGRKQQPDKHEKQDSMALMHLGSGARGIWVKLGPGSTASSLCGLQDLMHLSVTPFSHSWRIWMPALFVWVLLLFLCVWVDSAKFFAYWVLAPVSTWKHLTFFTSAVVLLIPKHHLEISYLEMYHFFACCVWCTPQGLAPDTCSLKFWCIKLCRFDWCVIYV